MPKTQLKKFKTSEPEKAEIQFKEHYEKAVDLIKESKLPLHEPKLSKYLKGLADKPKYGTKK